MDPITALLGLIVVTLLIRLLLPTAKNDGPTPGDFAGSIPETKEGKIIPVVFGRVWIRDPSVVWYGDVAAEPIQKCKGKK